MDFGKVAPGDIPGIDFTLPPDGVQTMRTLAHGKPSQNVDFRVGCSRWGRKDWVGNLYPPKTRESNMLDEYCKQFNMMELNAVFYSIPSAGLISAWREKIAANSVKPGFLFIPKVSRTITHIKRLYDAQAQMDLFMEAISQFGEYLGPIFLQIGDNFGPKNYEIVKKFIEDQPKDHRFFLEFRHEEWFSDPVERHHLFDLLAQHQIGTVITDSSGRRDVVHMELTIPEVMIRFVANGKDHRASDFARIDEWVDRLKQWKSRGLEKVYFITHQHDASDVYLLSKYVIEQFNKHLGANIPEIKLQPDVNEQELLFG
jgi:uncharacterized protein YecE (DUF72 family)